MIFRPSQVRLCKFAYWQIRLMQVRQPYKFANCARTLVVPNILLTYNLALRG